MRLLYKKNKFLLMIFICLACHVILVELVFAEDIILIPLSIRSGMESQMSLDWPLNDNKAVYKSRYFKEQKQMAKKAGINLKEKMMKIGTAKYNKDNGNFYMLFYNLAKAPSCDREYLVQRVKLTKSYFKKNGKLYKKKYEYLVEIMKTKNRTVKRADEHFRSYSLSGAYRREIKVEAEIGCGVVTGEAEGKKWPYKRSSLYELVQDYSGSIGFYDDINFDFSKKYSFGGSFQEEKLNSVSWPDFMR